MTFSPDEHGQSVYRNISSSQLLETTIQNRESHLADTGSLVVETGKRTGRSPKERTMVQEPNTSEVIDWEVVSQPFEVSAV